MSYISTNLNFLITVAKKAANPLTRDFNELEQLQSSRKGNIEFAKSALERTAKLLRVELQKGRPAYAVVTDGQERPNANHFLIAPIDGFLNFSHGLPYFAVSIAQVENGVVIASVVINPVTSDLYFAEKGTGAFKEGFRHHERLRVSGRRELAEALVGINDCTVKPEDVAAIRLNGSLSLDLAAVAAGHLDAEVAVKNTAAAVAAGYLLVKEAGGYVYELNQKDIRDDDPAAVMASGNLIAVNGELGKKLHQQFNANI